MQGSLIHESIERILIEELNAEVEVPVTKELTIDGEVYKLVGRVDAKKDNVIIEIKTSKTDVGIPKEEHVLQLRIYVNMLNAEHGILLYITPVCKPHHQSLIPL